MAAAYIPKFTPMSCPICGSSADGGHPTFESPYVCRCVQCGLYRTANAIPVEHIIGDDPLLMRGRATGNYYTSHAYRQFLTYFRQLMWMDCVKRFQAEAPPMQFSEYPAVITLPLLKDALKNHRFLNIGDQIDNAIFAFASDEQGLLTGYQDFSSKSKIIPETAIKNKDLLMLRMVGIDITDIDITRLGQPWVSDSLLGELDDVEVKALPTLFHASDSPAYKDLLSEMTVNGLIMDAHSFGAAFKQIKLTSKGWRHFNEMQSGARITSNAFMAMGFTESNKRACKHIFKPAVEACGFQLHTNYELPNHGSIPDDIELKIKRAPFVIVDISGGNNGAYWEAGYATALGKPVIYTCDEETWNNPTYKPHFDVRHRNTVKWVGETEEDIREKNQDALETIKAIIRNTIAGAKLDD